MSIDDTHVVARRAQFEALARCSDAERLAMVADLTRTTIHLSRQAIREVMPQADESLVTMRWIELTYGKELAGRVRPFADELGGELPT